MAFYILLVSMQQGLERLEAFSLIGPPAQLL